MGRRSVPPFRLAGIPGRPEENSRERGRDKEREARGCCLRLFVRRIPRPAVSRKWTSLADPQRWRPIAAAGAAGRPQSGFMSEPDNLGFAPEDNRKAFVVRDGGFLSPVPGAGADASVAVRLPRRVAVSLDPAKIARRERIREQVRSKAFFFTVHLRAGQMAAEEHARSDRDWVLVVLMFLHEALRAPRPCSDRALFPRGLCGRVRWRQVERLAARKATSIAKVGV